MNYRTFAPLLLVIALAYLAAPVPAATADADWQVQHDSLVTRLHKLAADEGRFGPAWKPVYHAALTWYERWGGNPRHEVDDWMVQPETYAAELADALEHGRNYLAENPGALIPLAFDAKLADGRTVAVNYWLKIPAGFAVDDRKFPLVIGLHGSGWLGHKLSFVRHARKDPTDGRAFTVTPINEAGSWPIDFLNAYLDELIRILPIDTDRVYCEGHSLGGMATWEWALNNPERFAAISPRAARGEPYRATRLRNVPAWVIHGGKDNVVFSGFADEMVTALEACGGRVRYTVMPDVEHNMPDDLDQSQVLDWYLQQTRSHAPVPPDPRDQLGIKSAGFSSWEVVADPPATGWKSEPISMTDYPAWVRTGQVLFDRVHARGQRVDSSIAMQVDPKSDLVSLWLTVPKSLHSSGQAADATTTSRPAGRSVRFYFRGPTKDALGHLAQVTQEARAAGHRPLETVWITPLSLWFDTPGYIAEYRVPIE